jgi:hypothetical protein
MVARSNALEPGSISKSPAPRRSAEREVDVSPEAAAAQTKAPAAPKTGAVAWDGSTPVYVLDVADDGSALVGRFASVEVTSASLSSSPPAPPEEDEGA